MAMVSAAARGCCSKQKGEPQPSTCSEREKSSTVASGFRATSFWSSTPSSASHAVASRHRALPPPAAMAAQPS